MTLGRDATYNRAALLLGLTSGERVVAWADEIIRRDAEPAPAILDVAMTPPSDLSALRHALQPLCDASESADTIRDLLGVAARDLARGTRTIDDTMRVFVQMRRLLPVPADWEREMDCLVDDHMLAVAGVVGDLREIEARTRAWLAPFETV